MRRVALLAVALLALAPAAAGATLRPQPLVDVPPAGPTAFPDRVLHRAPGAVARYAQRDATAYRAPDGTTVRVAFSPAYTPDPATAQSYVDFLGSLPHGDELASLALDIVPPAEVGTDCGGGSDILACYDAGGRDMIVPGEQIADTQGVSTSYVITHEYGHHVAAFRSDAPFPALDFGPKRWASYERVCAGVLAGKLAPGDEAARYLSNPGENWAETYARLTYPQQPWTFDSLLAPDAGALTAARADVLTPWTAPRVRTFTGRFTATGAATRTFRFTLTLDGALHVALHAARGARLDLSLSTPAGAHATTHGRGADDVLDYAAACRTQRREPVTLTVRRRTGTGPFTLRAAYAG